MTRDGSSACGARSAPPSARSRSPSTPPIRNGGVLRLAEKNAAAAGVRDQIRFTRCDAAAAPAPEGPGLCAVNPPFGVRLEEGTQKAWQALSTLSKRLFRFDLVVLGPDKGLEKVLTLSPLSSLPVQNGGMKCKIFHYRL